MKNIKIDVSSENCIELAVQQGVEEVEDYIYELLNSTKLIEFLNKNLRKILNKIANNEIFGSNTLRLSDLDGSDKELYDYFNSFDSEVINNEIILYNDAILDTSEKIINDPMKRKNYPLKLSLAQIIEYGTGVVGSTTDLPDGVSWQYDVNNYGEKGWWYFDKNGQAHFTRGFEGRLIFLKLILWIKENAGQLIESYLIENM